MRRILPVFLLFTLAGAGCSAKTGGGAAESGDGTSAPTSSTSTSAGAKVQLTWTASTGNPSGYHVEQSTDGASFARVTTAGSNSVTLTGLSVGTRYYFRVRAYNSGGTSSYSATVSILP